MDQLADPPQTAFVFGPFRLEPGRRKLERSGNPVSLNARAFDLLVVLVQARNRIVSRTELLGRVWPGLAVDEHNLSVQISSLRRALGDATGEPELIATIPGRGYRFVGKMAGSQALTHAIQGNPQAAETEACASLVEPVSATAGAGTPFSSPPRLSTFITAPWAASSLMLAIAVLAASAWVLSKPAGTGASPPLLSIAVLPFQDLSDDPEKSYLADAVSDDLTAAFSRLPGSFVVGRSSAGSFKGTKESTALIGAKLGVQYLVQGGIRTDHATLHMNVFLLDAASGKTLWSNRTDIACECKVLKTQESVVDQIVSALDPQLVKLAAARSIQERPNNPTAIDLFFRARSILDRDTSLQGSAQAQALLESALRQEPSFPEALTALGKLLLGKTGGNDDPDYVTDEKRARQVIFQALALAPNDPDALIAKADLLVAEDDCATATGIYAEALAIDPNNVEARGGTAMCALARGDPAAAIQPLRDAVRIDPFNPGVSWRYSRLADASMMLEDYPQALAWLRLAGYGNLDPNLHHDNLGDEEFNTLSLIAALDLSGQAQTASKLYQSYATIWPHRSAWRMAGYFEKANAGAPWFKRFLAGLQAAGMPKFSDESEEFHIPTAASGNGDFDPTPLHLDGANRITTAQLQILLASGPPPLILDVGRGVAAIPGSIWQSPEHLNQDTQSFVVSEAAQHRIDKKSGTVVVLGDGPFGPASFNAARKLVEMGYEKILWYRGGEEAWAKSGLPSVDHRPQ